MLDISPPPLQKLQRPPSMHESVQEAIRQYIITNQLHSGASLPSENKLSQQLGVSRNLVREAVRGLAALGVVEIRRGSGLYVSDFSLAPLVENLPYGMMHGLQEFAELLEVREALETSLIGKAMRAMTAEQREAVAAAQAEMAQANGDQTDFVTPDRLFHQALFASLNNKTLLKVLDAFWLVFQQASHYHEQLGFDQEIMLTIHQQIANAVTAENSTEAEQALKRHYQTIRNLWRLPDVP